MKRFNYTGLAALMTLPWCLLALTALAWAAWMDFGGMK